MKKPGRKLQKRTMGLLRNLMILGVSFVGLTVVLQLEIEYNLAGPHLRPVRGGGAAVSAHPQPQRPGQAGPRR